METNSVFGGDEDVRVAREPRECEASSLLCRGTWKDHNAFTFRAKQSKNFLKMKTLWYFEKSHPTRPDVSATPL
jgi:hypothetical protein